MHWHPYISEQLIKDHRRELLEQAQTHAARQPARAARRGSLDRLMRIGRAIGRVHVERRREHTPAMAPMGRKLSVSP